MILPLAWTRLPPLPDPEGFASPFAGVSRGALLVAGGANFPARRPWEGGVKQWHDRIFVLSRDGGSWSAAGRLARPAAYGVSVSHGDEVICAGGGDARIHFADTLALRWDGTKVSIRPLPPLPGPCSFAAGARVDHTLYLAGGLEAPAAPEALRTFWSLDLSVPGARWREREPWPGPERAWAVCAASGGAFYLFGGVALRPGAGGKPVRGYHRDAYVYVPAAGWRRLPDLPRPAAAAPSPAPVLSNGTILICSGDDGTRVHLDGPGHPGFPRDIQAFLPAQNRWAPGGEAPFSRGTAPTAEWDGRWVVISGERIPGCRSNEIWGLREAGPPVF